MEEIKNTQTLAPVISNKDDLVNALKQNFATTVNRIYLNSIQLEVGFREITVLEQKTLSRTLIDNENRLDVVYDAQCGIINKACLVDGFDIYRLKECDRLKLLISIYQANMFKNDINFVCPECGCENSYKLDFAGVLHRLDELDVSDKIFEYENTNFKYKFVLGYPTVARVSRFYRNYVKTHRVNNRNKKSNDAMSSIEYINQFIAKVEIFNKTTKQATVINLADDYMPEDVEEIMAVFPQDVLYHTDGVINYIAVNFIKAINNTFDSHHCIQCGAENKTEVSSIASFL